mmetsp:Transcript_4451/g.17776  ORF Transcript_4451/g.17776 Transcript_4451/m.17776 type:complete len:205 (-) Transcript_4451:2345-2959(-)
MDRLRQRLQDARSHLHGIRVVGVQDAVGEGPGVQGVQGDAVLHRVQHPPLQLRGWPGLPRRLRPRRDGGVPHRRLRVGRVARGVDHDALDASLQPRALRQPHVLVRVRQESRRRGVCRRGGASLGASGRDQKSQGRQAGRARRRLGRGEKSRRRRAPRRQVRADFRFLRRGDAFNGVSRVRGLLRHRRQRHGHRAPGPRVRRGR